MKAYTKELDDLAAWFDACGIGELDCEQVACIIRKWVPDAIPAPPASTSAEPAAEVCAWAAAELDRLCTVSGQYINGLAYVRYRLLKAACQPAPDPALTPRCTGCQHYVPVSGQGYAKCHLARGGIDIIAAELRAVNAHEGLVEALEAYRKAYPHDAPHDCFSTGPMTGDLVADYVICPGCQAEAQARAALAPAREEKA